MAPNQKNQTTTHGDAKISEKFKEIVRSNGINDAISEVIVKDACLQGEGFASLTQLATVKFENAEIKPLNLFVKVHTQSPSHTAMIEEMRAFQKETTFLVDYQNAAKEMCKLKGLEGFIDFYPKCYYGDEKMVVMENLVLDKGYSTISMDFKQDLEAAKVALETLAKHHAIGHVMIQENGGAKGFFERFPNLDFEAYDKPIFSSMMAPTHDSSINSNIKFLQVSGLQEADATTAILKSLFGKGWPSVLAALKSKPDDDDNLLVLGHGDYWNNNMMFQKDNKTKEIKHHVAIDFQVTRYNSLALDLSYYLFTSVQPKVRKNHWRELLDFYRTRLNSITEDFGHPINLTMEKLLLEYRKKFEYGFWTGFNFTGPGMELAKQVDFTSIEVSAWADAFTDVLDKWIEDNPEKSVKVAEDLVELVQEREELLLAS